MTKTSKINKDILYASTEKDYHKLSELLEKNKGKIDFSKQMKEYEDKTIVGYLIHNKRLNDVCFILEYMSLGDIKTCMGRGHTNLIKKITQGYFAEKDLKSTNSPTNKIFSILEHKGYFTIKETIELVEFAIDQWNLTLLEFLFSQSEVKTHLYNSDIDLIDLAIYKTLRSTSYQSKITLNMQRFTKLLLKYDINLKNSHIEDNIIQLENTMDFKNKEKILDKMKKDNFLALCQKEGEDYEGS